MLKIIALSVMTLAVATACASGPSDEQIAKQVNEAVAIVNTTPTYHDDDLMKLGRCFKTTGYELYANSIEDESTTILWYKKADQMKIQVVVYSKLKRVVPAADRDATNLALTGCSIIDL